VLNKLVKSRSLQTLKSEHSSPAVRNHPTAFRFLEMGGIYSNNSEGWTGTLIHSPDKKHDFFVLGGVLGQEDVGAQVFEMQDGKLSTYIPELDNFGFKITNHDFDVKFQPSQQLATVKDTLVFKQIGTPSSYIQLRLGQHYKISSITRSNGSPVKFEQGSGVVCAEAPKDGEKWTFQYAGVVNLPPGMGGMIKSSEASLSGDLWYPTIARNACTHSVRVTVPNGWTAIAQGKLLSRSGDVWSFRMDVPNSVFALSAAPYRSASTMINGVTYTTLSLKMSQEQMEWQNQLNADVIQFYGRAFKPYPFDHWTSLVSSCMFGGALEAYSHATYMEGWLPDQDAHEPAHTWFGGIAPNTYMKSLWNESFADYCETFFLREGGRCNRTEARQAFYSVNFTQPGFKRFAQTTANNETGGVGSSIGYNRGGKALQALESFIGTDKMLQTIRLFLGKVQPGTNPEWDDFAKALVEVNGPDAKVYFDEWFARPGYPEMKITNVQAQSNGLTGNVDFGATPYHFPIEVMVRYSDGTTTTERVRLNGSGQFQLPLNKRPVWVSFDPLSKLMGTGFVAPRGILSSMRGTKRFVAPEFQGSANAILGGNQSLTDTLPNDLAGVTVFAHPAHNDAARLLASKAGITVSGDVATYDGTMVDLNHGGFAALVELGDGKRAVVAFGKVKLGANLGFLKFAMFDELGRILRCKKDPRLSGDMAFDLK